MLLLEISATCTVRVANELDIPDEALESDGGGIQDIAWPKKDGPIFLVNGVETWAWAELPSPLTAARDALEKVNWTPTKVGAMEPEGYQYGLTTDGTNAILVGCAKWSECSPDAEECEEWECKKTLFVDPHTKKKVKQPRLPFVEPYDTKKCPDMEDAPDRMVVLSPTEWIALTTTAGSRMNAKWGVWAQYVTGCEAELVERAVVVGPNQLWARSTETGWALQHGPRGGALTDATGKLATFGDTHFVWTSH